MLTKDDEELIEALCEERRILHRQIRQLTNRAIADKFETTAAEVARISKYGSHRRGVFD